VKSSLNSNEYLPIFKDITLNFNNNKYIELLKSLKILILFNLEIQKIPFSDLQKYMKSIFHEYDIYSYIENIQYILNYENIIFFINYNFNSSKIYVIILFCILFEKHDFMRNIFSLLLNLDNYMSFSAEKKDLHGLLCDQSIEGNKQNEAFNQAEFFAENFDLNKEFVFYLTCILDFLKEFSFEFENFDFLASVKLFFVKVFNDSNEKNMKLLYKFFEEYLTN
jgi:hypothetical protein